MARLTMLRGPTVGTVYDLNETVVTIGRGSKNNIVIRDNEVSREHCRFVRVTDGYEVEDLGSSNGTFINGQRVIGNWLLRTGFLVEFGDSITLEYDNDTAVGEASAAAAAEVEVEAVYRGPRFALLMTVGPDAGHIFPLEEDIIKIGRDLSNDLVIQDPEVSRVHLRFRRLTDGYEVEEMGSTNGSTLNGVTLRAVAVLKQADVLKLGSTVQLQFVNYNDDPATLLANHETVLPPIDLSNHTRETNPAMLTPALTKRRKTSHLGTGLEPGALDNHIYIAYAREDWEKFIAALTVSLQDAGLQVWVDQYLKPGGDDWLEAIEQALYECWLMVVVVSENSINQPNVKMQFRYFMNRDKPIIPLMLNPEIELPVELGRQHPVPYTPDDFRGTIHRLVFEIKEMRKLLQK